jgi:hypothetical protein
MSVNPLAGSPTLEVRPHHEAIEAMTIQHVVKRGETLSGIAELHGFRNWKTVYDAPENADLRAKRPNPHLILVGDVVVIPDRKPKAETVNSGEAARFKRLPAVPQPAMIEIGFFDRGSPNTPVPNLSVTFSVSTGTQTIVRALGSDGVLRLEEPEVAAGARVDVLDIRDETEAPIIRYTEFSVKGLVVNQSHIITLPDKRKVINRIAAAHALRRRATWGARPPRLAEMEQDWDFNMIVIHHSGNRGRKEPKSIQDFHMDESKFDDVAYQYLVLPDGTIAEGRYLAHKGAANAAVNTGKIGILVAGDFHPEVLDFDDEEPTVSQLSTVPALVNTLRREFPAIKKLVGHRDIKADTECPGDDLHKHLPAFRTSTGLAGP